MSQVPKTEEEKREQQAAKIQLLRESLSEDLEKLETELRKVGEFRGTEKLDDAYLRRWLRVHRWKVESAETRLRAHAEWRSTFYRGAPRIAESDIANELPLDKIRLQGRDHAGRGFAIVVGRLHKRGESDVDELERMMCYALDKQMDIADIEKNPGRRTAVLFDLSKVGLLSIDVMFMRKYFNLLTEQFVDTFGKIYMFDAPTIFWAAWKAFSPIIPKEALKMIKFIYPKNLTELHAEVPLDILPKEYGGTADFIPVQNYKT